MTKMAYLVYSPLMKFIKKPKLSWKVSECFNNNNVFKYGSCIFILVSYSKNTNSSHHLVQNIDIVAIKRICTNNLDK